MADDQKQLATVTPRERSDDQPLIAGSSHRSNESFLLQPMQCASNGRTAQAHPRHHGSLGDPRSRRQLAGDD
jgi:hypothetical protein